MDSSGCYVESGRWVDPYTGDEYTSADEVTIDHVVPLAEAHRAGAWRWDLDTRYRFANDEYPGHLLVVGADVNQSKADKRPDEWLPPDPAAHCGYAMIMDANGIDSRPQVARWVRVCRERGLLPPSGRN